MPAFTPQRLAPASFNDHVRAKWSDETLGEGFVPFPKTLLRTMYALLGGEEAVAELGVILALADYRRRNAKTKPSLEYLAFIAGMPPEQFGAALDRLVKKGWAEKRADSTDENVNVATKGLEAAIRAALPAGGT